MIKLQTTIFFRRDNQKSSMLDNDIKWALGQFYWSIDQK